MPTPQQIAQMIMQQHPEIQQNPMQMQMLQAVLNNDAKAGIGIAQNICQTRGVSPQDTAAQAQNFFSQQPPFQGR